MISGESLGSLVDFFNFCIDFFVDSVPRSSLTTVDPKYCNKINPLFIFKIYRPRNSSKIKWRITAAIFNLFAVIYKLTINKQNTLTLAT